MIKEIDNITVISISYSNGIFKGNCNIRFWATTEPGNLLTDKDNTILLFVVSEPILIASGIPVEFCIEFEGLLFKGDIKKDTKLFKIHKDSLE